MSSSPPSPSRWPFVPSPAFLSPSWSPYPPFGASKCWPIFIRVVSESFGLSHQGIRSQFRFRMGPTSASNPITRGRLSPQHSPAWTFPENIGSGESPSAGIEQFQPSGGAGDHEWPGPPTSTVRATQPLSACPPGYLAFSCCTARFEPLSAASASDTANATTSARTAATISVA